MEKLDMRILAFATLGKELEKKVLTSKVKNTIREKDYITTYNEYGVIKPSKYTSSAYNKEDQAKIDAFIKEQGFEKVKTVKEDYTITIVPSEKAIKAFNAILDNLTENKQRDIAKAASKIQKAIKPTKKK